MCKLCNGKRVVHEDTQGTITFHTCPNCGPYTGEEQQLRYQKIRNHIKELEALLKLKSA